MDVQARMKVLAEELGKLEPWKPLDQDELSEAAVITDRECDALFAILPEHTITTRLEPSVNVMFPGQAIAILQSGDADVFAAMRRALCGEPGKNPDAWQKSAEREMAKLEPAVSA